ncbi:helix-turn-helix domain-containing protein [Aeromicrobium sp. CF4.19]|uniref:helix-turn-helix domain-containing protein n=1 Tax=Aeromicrobium sp. CF4.19 TaxID=3373082 RepID=UPI003EE582EC
MSSVPRDRLSDLLDAVLSDDHLALSDMAAGAHASPFHFSRQLRSATGEPPVTLRRRVLLERAAWHLQRDTSVTVVALEAGFDSVEGFARAFSRAYGHPPSAMPAPQERGHWLPAPNGIHFHGPTVLYVDAGEAREHPSGDVLELMARHDLDDVAILLDAAKALDDAALGRSRLSGHSVLAWDGPDESLTDLLRHLALGKEPWLATLSGADAPDLGVDGVAALASRHEEIAGRWLAWVRDVDRRGAWSDRVIDALCDPPESFLLGQVLAHVLTFSSHRRQLARWMLRDAGVPLDAPEHDPDPIMWHRRHAGDVR